MSFADRETIFELTEQLIVSAWPHQLNIPLPRLTYQEVMQKYGSDKPDLRLEEIFLYNKVCTIIPNCFFIFNSILLT